MNAPTEVSDQLISMLLSSTPTIDGRKVQSYAQVIGAEVIFGANFLKDIVADVVDTFGGRNDGYEKVFADARKEALAELSQQAEAIGANGVINIKFSYQILGEKNGMMMVAAIGTAVRLVKTDEELQRDAHALREREPAYFVVLDGRQRGPFSVQQLRDLRAAGKLSDEATTHLENGEPSETVAAILK